MVNRVILIGNLGRDPEIRSLENGAVVAKFPLATNENYRDKTGEWQQTTEWHDIVVWRALAERAQATLHKGTMVYVEGKLTHRTWQDQDGNNRRTTEVVASYFRIIGGRQQSDGPDAGKEEDDLLASTPSEENSSADEFSGSAADDDLPF